MLLLALSCIGTRSVRDGKINKLHIGIFAGIGTLLYFASPWLLELRVSVHTRCLLYIIFLIGGFLCLLTAGVWIGRLLNTRIDDDLFNEDNESFPQETRLINTDDSINLPTLFYYKKK